MSDKNGGPAFPQIKCWNAERAEYEDTQQNPGMTLRDYFAAKAMQAYLSINDIDGEVGYKARQSPDICAVWAYQNADAMLKAREQS